MLKVDVEMFVDSWHTHCVRQRELTVSETVSCEPNYIIGVYPFCGAAGRSRRGVGRVFLIFTLVILLCARKLKHEK